MGVDFSGGEGDEGGGGEGEGVERGERSERLGGGLVVVVGNGSGGMGGRDHTGCRKSVDWGLPAKSLNFGPRLLTPCVDRRGKSLGGGD